MKQEIRTLADNYKPQLREIEGEETSRIIEGYAVVFNEKSQVLCDWSQDYEYFREIISADAVTQEDLAKWDIKLNLYHNRERILARSNRTTDGSLQLIVDEVGVKFIAEMPKTPDGQTALELVKRGDLTGCSFAFVDEKDSVIWSKDDDGVPVRTVGKIAEMFDVCLAGDPAYLQTSVSAREILNHNEPEANDDPSADAEYQARCRRLFILGITKDY